MQTKKTKRSRIWGQFRALLILPLCLMFSASRCADQYNSGYNLDPEFSINVGTIDADWPKDIEDLDTAKQHALEFYGRPDYFHLIWSPRSDILTESEHYKLMRDAADQNWKTGKPPEPGFGWIYMKKNIEVIFLDSARYEEKKLTAQMRLIAEKGDPQRKRMVRIPGGRTVEEWTYFGLGIIYKFEDGMIISEDHNSIPAQGNWIMR